MKDSRFEQIGDKGYRFRRLAPRPVSIFDRIANMGSNAAAEKA
jgi:hypothetical protein